MIEMLNIFQKIFRGRVKQELDVNINATTVDENSHNQQEEIVPSIKCSSSNILQNDKIDVYTHEEFKNAINFGEKVQCDIVIREGCIENLAPVTTIEGTLGLSDCNIESLSPLKIVLGEIWCSYHNKKPILKTLGTLQRVEGNANFRYMPLESLGDLEYVGGNLSLRDTNISNLGNLRHIGGNLFLPKRLKGLVDLSNITIGGQVRYWNDVAKLGFSDDVDKSKSILTKSAIPVPYWAHTYIYPNHNICQESTEIRRFYEHFKKCFEDGVLLDTEGCSNYYFMLVYDLQRQYSNPCKLAEKYNILATGYPKVRGYCDNILIDLYNHNRMWPQAWDIIKEAPALSLKTIYEYMDRVGEHIFDGKIAAKLCGINCLTNFGKSHKDEVFTFFKECLQTFEAEHGCKFYDLFYDSDKGYKAIEGKYQPEYYRQFYKLDEGSFNLYNEIGKGDYHSRHLDRILVVEHAIIEQLRLLLINAEDAYRVSIGVPKIGEGWINETALYYKIKEHFKDYKVVQHGHPKWLGKQHLDIYFTKENIGIEYQGIQHYKAVDYFGGEEGFAKNQERDERKLQLCKENSCTLIYVNEGYNFKDVVDEIDKAIKQQKNS